MSRGGVCRICRLRRCLSKRSLRQAELRLQRFCQFRKFFEALPSFQRHFLAVDGHSQFVRTGRPDGIVLGISCRRLLGMHGGIFLPGRQFALADDQFLRRSGIENLADVVGGILGNRIRRTTRKF